MLPSRFQRMLGWFSPRRWAMACLDEVVLRDRPVQIAGGLFLGLALGFNSWLTLQGALLFCAFLCLRLNWLAVFLGLAIAAPFSLVAQPVFHSVGDFVLTRTPNYFRLWAGLYHAPLLPFTRFHNTVCMGGIVFTVLLALPLAGVAYFIVMRHGNELLLRFRRTMLFERILETRIWRIYGRHRSITR